MKHLWRGLPLGLFIIDDSLPERAPRDPVLLERMTHLLSVHRERFAFARSAWRAEDLVLPDPPRLPAVIGIPRRQRGFLAGVPRQLEAALAARDLDRFAHARTRWLHHAGLRWSP